MCIGILSDVSNEDLKDAVLNNTTWVGVALDLGIKNDHGKYNKYIKRALDNAGIDYSHLEMAPRERKDVRINIPDDEIFCRNNGISICTVRRRLVKNNLKPYICAICGMEPFWNGAPLVLTMDHIDGDTNNNELSNLRWICPNCDRQLPTYAGRNKPHGFTKSTSHIKNICPLCGKEKSKGASTCLECYQRAISTRHKKNTPDRDVLKSEIRTKSFSSIGRKYNVTDNTIRKWCSMYGLPTRVKDIKSIDDKTWGTV